MKILTRETIMPYALDKRACHASHLLPLDDGSVFAVWFEGTREGEKDVCIWGAMRNPDGEWSEKARLTEDDGEPNWNPVLFKKDDGTVLLFYKKGTPIAKWYTMVRASSDGCRTFGPARELVPGDRGGRGPVRNKILRLSDGTLAAPASDEGFMWTAFIDLSKDTENWTKTENKNIFRGAPKAKWVLGRLLDRSKYRKARGIIQPTLWESEPGRVHALMRSSEGRVYRMDSSDTGRSWCRPYKTGLPNNNSGIDLDRLPDGRLALVYNPVGSNWGARNPISLAVSNDNGHTWAKQADLELSDKPSEFSYPCVIAVGNVLHVSYTQNRTNIAYLQIEM